NTFSTMSPTAGTMDDSLFQSERNSSSGRLNYAFPVNNGQYNVILHFAEIYYQGVGNRIFDVEIEGVTVLNNYDILKKAGFNTAITESFIVNVADGTLDVDLSSLVLNGGRDRPKLSAIEILGNSGNRLPIALAGSDITLTLPVNSALLDGSGTDADGAITNYQWTQVSGPNIATFNNSTLEAPKVSELIEGTYLFRLVVKDNYQLPGFADEVSIKVNPVSTAGRSVYRINSGGGQVTSSQGIFLADNSFSPSPGDTYSTSKSISGTIDESLYKTERNGSAGSFKYSFAVVNGQYTVVLHFAEIYYTFPNSRVFDVAIEGLQVLDNYDIVKEVGSFVATTERFNVNVTDEVLNIDFSSLERDGGHDRAKISAIEVLDNSGEQGLFSSFPASKALPVQESSQKLMASLRRNSGNTYFNILISGTSKTVEAKIFNASGQLVQKTDNLKAGDILKTGSWYPPGVYYAIIQQGNERVILKFKK
ncbi:MAG: malectin domain-containing carbohydrate-binding protein, partial [Segetibacter sp.]